MKIISLKKFDLIYVASPFTLYGAGLNAAFIDVSRVMAGLVKEGIYNAISPIVEAYPISFHGNVDPLDLGIWVPFCAARIARCDALVVAMLNGWERSSGTLHEIRTFVRDGKPVYFLDPVRLVLEEPNEAERQQFLQDGEAA